MSLFRRKNEDLNRVPFNPDATPEQKAKEFDQQYGQNRKFSRTPNADKVVEPKSGGRHAAPEKRGFFGRKK